MDDGYVCIKPASYDILDILDCLDSKLIKTKYTGKELDDLINSIKEAQDSVKDIISNMPLLTQSPRGTQDVLPQDSYKWQYVENKMRDICSTFGYGELRTPTFEHTELFARGVGDSTDVVDKEMYTFEDRGLRSITLRPEGTAGAVRALIQAGAFAGTLPVRAYNTYRG